MGSTIHSSTGMEALPALACSTAAALLAKAFPACHKPCKIGKQEGKEDDAWVPHACLGRQHSVTGEWNRACKQVQAAAHPIHARSIQPLHCLAHHGLAALVALIHCVVAQGLIEWDILQPCSDAKMSLTERCLLP